MSLYRTWRPKSFADLVGQDAVVRTLRTALESGKLAHAYLFSGPRGSGKTSAAKIMARCIDCVHGPTPQPDNSCENCLAMLAGTALDVVEIDAASNRGIEEIRALREAAKFAPSSMRMKVFIVDEAHMLTREGANAFLKTLEEPPPHVVFILATTAPEALPPTILSRCQRYAFRRIPVGVMVERMREISTAEGIVIDDDALAAIAYRADGGLRDALTMLEQVASYAGPHGTAVTATTVDAAFGITGRHYARGIVDAVLAGDAARSLRLVDEASDAGADMLGLIRGTIGEYRNLLVARVDAGLLSRDLSASDSEAALALAVSTPQPKIVRGLRLLADALAAGRLSGSPRLELETAILRLVLAGEDSNLESLATRVALLEGGAGAGSAAPAPRRAAVDVAPKASPESLTRTSPAKPVVPQPTVADVAPAVSVAREPSIVQADPIVPAAIDAAVTRDVTLQQVRSLWDQIRLRVEETHKPLKGPLSRASVDSVDDGVLTIAIPDSIQAELVREKLDALRTAVEEVLRTPLRIVLRSHVTAGAPRAPVKSAHRAQSENEDATASATGAGGEIDLLAYARKKIGGTEKS